MPIPHENVEWPTFGILFRFIFLDLFPHLNSHGVIHDLNAPDLMTHEIFMKHLIIQKYPINVLREMRAPRRENFTPAQTRVFDSADRLMLNEN